MVVKCCEKVKVNKNSGFLPLQFLFKVAENSLESHTTLQKVVILNQIPRYDTKNADPLQIKAALSQIYNNKLKDLWMNSPLKSKIYVGSHTIDCSGGIREARYRCTQSGRYDGVHLYGPSGIKAYTNSVTSYATQNKYQGNF